jgi:hypothetical protein
LQQAVSLYADVMQASTLAISHLSWLATHSSFAVQGSAYPIPSQNFSVNFQLESGVRAVEIELHYIGQLNSSTGADGGPFRVCHTPFSTALPDACAKIGWTLCESYGIPHYDDEDVGCTPSAISFVDALNQVSVGCVSHLPMTTGRVDFDLAEYHNIVE